MGEKRSAEREDYLRAIYELDEEKGAGVRSVDISRKLKISKASVSEMLKKLAEEKLVNIKPYSKILLTIKGKKLAENLFDQHFILKNFLKKVLGHDEEKAGQEAHKLEHAFSLDSVKILERLMENKPFEEPKDIIKPAQTYIG